MVIEEGFNNFSSFCSILDNVVDPSISLDNCVFVTRNKKKSKEERRKQYDWIKDKKLRDEIVNYIDIELPDLDRPIGKRHLQSVKYSMKSDKPQRKRVVADRHGPKISSAPKSSHLSGLKDTTKSKPKLRQPPGFKDNVKSKSSSNPSKNTSMF